MEEFRANKHNENFIVYNRLKGKMFYISLSLEQMEVTSTDAYTSMHTTEYTRTTEPRVHMSNITADILQSATNEPPPGMTLASPLFITRVSSPALKLFCRQLRPNTHAITDAVNTYLSAGVELERNEVYIPLEEENTHLHFCR